MQESNVLCKFPFVSLVVTAEKKIHPCCKFTGNLGMLNDKPLSSILADEPYQTLRQQMKDNVWPTACSECYEAEKSYNNSLRINGGVNTYSGIDHIYVLEISSSNVCNLSCSGCSTRFSSGWLKYAKAIDSDPSKDFYRAVIKENPIIRSNNNALVDNLKTIDLSKCHTLFFKGGEPFLNNDMLEVLRYFNSINQLSRMRVYVDTSGAVIVDSFIKEAVSLLSKTKSVQLNLSIDGPANVQEYIRYSAKNMASLDKLCSFIGLFEDCNATIVLSPTIMSYNIFLLDKLIEWWLYEMPTNFSYKLKTDVRLLNFLIGPEYLSLKALLPGSINKLIAHYKNIIDTKEYGYLFAHFPDALQRVDYGGDDLHNQMVIYTTDMDRIKNQSIYKSIPEFADQMVIL